MMSFCSYHIPLLKGMKNTMYEVSAITRIKVNKQEMIYKFCGFLFGLINIPIVYFVDTSTVYKIGSWLMQAIFILITFFMLLVKIQKSSQQEVSPIFALGIMGCILIFNTIINRRELAYALRFAILFFSIPAFIISVGRRNIISIMSGLSVYYRLLIISNIIVFIIFNPLGGLYNRGQVREYYLCGHVNSFVKIALPGIALQTFLDLKQGTRLSKRTTVYTIAVFYTLICMHSYVALIGMIIYEIALLTYAKLKKIPSHISTLAPIYLSVVLFAIVCLFRMSEVTNRILDFGSSLQRTGSVSSRMRMWTQGWNAVMKNPWGYGCLSDFSDFIRLGSYLPSTSHNFYIDIMLQAGIVGVICIVLFMCLCLRHIEDAEYYRVIMPMMFSFSIMCNFEPYFGIENLGGILVLLSLGIVLKSKEKR